MNTYRIDIQKLLESGDPTDIFIKLTSAIVDSPAIEPGVKIGILHRLVDCYEKITGVTLR